LPLALPDLLSYAFYRFECSIRAAAVLGIVGAGGLGFEIALSFQDLDYEAMWTFIFALVVLSGLADMWSTRIRSRRVGRPAVRGGSAVGPGHDRFLLFSAVGGVALVVWSALHVGLSLAPLTDSRTSREFERLVSEAVPPDFASVGLHEFASLSADTVAMSVIAAAFAGLGGIGLAYLAADLGRLVGAPRRRRATRALAMARMLAMRAFMLFLRAVPPPVWALLCVFVLYPGVWPGALALGLYTLGIVGRLDTEVIDNQDARPAHALRDLGASRSQVLVNAVTPLAASRFAAFALYRWEVAMRETVVIGAVGAGGLGVLLKQQLSQFDYAAATATVIVLIALTLLIDLISAGLRGALR
jgi:phosphonate transport system permease protein